LTAQGPRVSDFPWPLFKFISHGSTTRTNLRLSSLPEPAHPKASKLYNVHEPLPLGPTPFSPDRDADPIGPGICTKVMWPITEMLIVVLGLDSALFVPNGGWVPAPSGERANEEQTTLAEPSHVPVTHASGIDPDMGQSSASETRACDAFRSGLFTGSWPWSR
jgi:hypothetical protein